MQFWWSGETQREASPAFMRCVRATELILTELLVSAPVVSGIDVKIRYVPIIMPESMRARYPARTRNKKKERIFDCAPQLDYDVFVEGDFPRCVSEYLDGMAREAPKMKGLGLSKAEIQAFIDVLEEVEKQALANPPPEPHPHSGSMGGKK